MCMMHLNMHILFKANIESILHHIQSRASFQVGMDKAITNLTVPLGEMKDQVMVSPLFFFLQC